MKIDINVFKLPGSVISQVKKCYVELLNDKFIYCHDYEIDIPANLDDDVFENEEFRVTDKAVYKKSAIIGASLTSKRMYDDANSDVIDTYSVIIPVSGVSDEIEIIFETLKEANAFHIKMTNYIFSNES